MKKAFCIIFIAAATSSVHGMQLAKLVYSPLKARPVANVLGHHSTFLNPQKEHQKKLFTTKKQRKEAGQRNNVELYKLIFDLKETDVIDEEEMCIKIGKTKVNALAKLIVKKTIEVSKEKPFLDIDPEKIQLAEQLVEELLCKKINYSIYSYLRGPF